MPSPITRRMLGDGRFWPPEGAPAIPVPPVCLRALPILDVRTCRGTTSVISEGSGVAAAWTVEGLIAASAVRSDFW